MQVPITYVNEVGWQQEILRFAPTLLLIGAYIYITRRTMGGGGLGGLGGGGSGGGRNIFNVGKAQVGNIGFSWKRLCEYSADCCLLLPKTSTALKGCAFLSS